ncbi:hypothetical protein [Rhizobium leguminosarum]|uniref:hypothetical protein n=1 Tax=Rhizobium leguminosarum TaxID=384 RepID=UPI0024B3460B|nr:hypothetical protein [Rhizobium leguminosarum]WHO78796.1 hypothetical protein QMO81_001462 [Rhizobium leguminosarum]
MVIFIRLLIMIAPLCVLALQCSTVEASTRAPCSEEQLLRAVSSERRIKLSIENIYSTPVTVYVLNDAGKRFDMAKIEAGHTIEFETFDTFPVVVADSDGRCLEITGEHLNTDVAEFPPPPETSDVAIQLLALAFKCPLPIRTIPNPYDGKKDGYWHEARQARLLGSVEQLSFRFKKQQYLSVSDGIHDRYRTLDESLSVFPIDINEVKVNVSDKQTPSGEAA